MKETTVEQYLVSEVKRIGGKALKMVPTYQAGIPDRLVLYKGQSIFVELKAPGKSRSAVQVIFTQELADYGFEAQLIDSKTGVDSFIEMLNSRF